MSDRGTRRHHSARVKSKMKNLWTNIWKVGGKATNKWVGVMASTHGKPCSCYACANKLGPDMQTRRADINHQEQKDEIPAPRKCDCAEYMQVVESDECAQHKCKLIKVCPECLPGIYDLLRK